MSLDTKYRPLRFDDVLGQEATIRVLRNFIAKGTGRRQSYLFAGPFGSGKTTLGRILARALLCEKPSEKGDPCDQCESCKSLLERGTSVDFIEVDAATNSGKAEIQKITEEIEYSSFTGRKQIYLFDESHQLSKDALDAMLKPLEENSPNSDEKKLVCIFCTTEPEKMRTTILSRCAPAFVIQAVEPEEIAKRLTYICDQEGIEHEEGMLRLIAEITECHIRDALKAIEGVSMLGPLNKENITSYLHLDHNDVYLDILANLGRDLSAVVKSARDLMKRTSPLTCYTALAKLAVAIYEVGIGATTPDAYWDATRFKDIYDQHQANLLGFAARLSSRPGRPTEAMLICDLGHLHHVGGSVVGAQPEMVVVQAGTPPEKSEGDKACAEDSKTSATESADSGKLSRASAPQMIKGEVEIDPRAVAKPGSSAHQEVGGQPVSSDFFDPDQFCTLLALRVAELGGSRIGPAGRNHLDRHRTLPDGGGEG